MESNPGTDKDLITKPLHMEVVTVDRERLMLLYNTSLLQKDLLDRLVVPEEYRYNHIALINTNQSLIKHLRSVLNIND